jgi:hypothetical protein
MADARVILELLYFLSGIVLTGVAIVGLRQVRIAAAQLNLSREIASANARREAAKLAAEQCRYFAEKCVPTFEHFLARYRANHLTFLEARLRPNEPQFVIQGGEFQTVNCDIPAIQREFPVVESELLAVLNGLEYFAIAFAAGVADEDIGYRETALGFCEALVFTMAAIYHLRTQNRGRYDSAVRLFEIWTRRTTARAVAPFMSSMQALITQANSDKIRIIGES